MSGFDDLLKQSQSALEDNPFADPFAKPRSSSPDPWSSWHEPTTSPPSSAFNYTHGAFGDEPSSSPSAAVDDSSVATPVAPTKALDPPHVPDTDPLDSATANAQDPEPAPAQSIVYQQHIDAGGPPLTGTSSGFRESIGESTPPRSPESPKQSPPTRPVSPPSVAHSPPPAQLDQLVTGTSEPSQTRLPQRQSVVQPNPPPPTDSPPQTAFSQSHSRIITPLDHPATTPTTFRSLALGGEALGGWEDTPSTSFTAPTSGSPVVNRVDDDDDDDDDKPLLPRPTEAKSPVTSEAKKGKPEQPLFTITVDDPQKVGDPIRGYTMYTVHTRTTSTLYAKPSFSVLRRYSDFLWLYETLSLNNPGVVVPPVPEKNTFGRFDDTFVQQRRLALQNCIAKIANHPVLCKDMDLKLFLESDTFSLDIKHRKAEIAHERGGLISSIGQSLTGPRFTETDEWFDRQKSHLDTLESQLRGLIKAIEIVSRNRSELATATGEFAQMIAELASSDLGQSLSHSLGELAELERKAQELEVAQAQADLVTFMSTADEYARLISSVRMAFTSRIRTYYSWQNAEAEARRMRQNHERNRAQGKIAADRIPHSLNLVADADRRALDAKQEFEHVSKLVKSEVARFERERIEDFKRALESFLDGMLVRQRELIATREAFQQVLLKKVQPIGASNAATEQDAQGNGSAQASAVM